MTNRLLSIHLTQQQQAIVDHNLGPALVFAVAGAGKTTAIEHRIARLVSEAVFDAERILATTFNTKNATELRSRLQRWPGCSAVQVSTLNALGHRIIKESFDRRQLPFLQRDAFEQINSADETILTKTKALAYERKVSFVDELETLDRDDFLNYVGKCKGNLCYADLENAAVAEEFRHLAKQAEAPKGFPWYLDLFKLYEQTRQQLGLFTFDDQLVLGWELLAGNPEIRQLFQQRYDCLLVDEFQDINKAQAEMLDLLSMPHRNYMAVGDDDQTIYEWRGADPSYILGFASRYKAQEYFMTENFRCKASQIVLANQVIKQNKQRREKSLQLTQGFAGGSWLVTHDSLEAMGASVVRRVQQLQAQQVSIREMAVLVRIYAQTPLIEQQLILHNIPYEILGNVPFYMRSEVTALIGYCRLAYLEKERIQRATFSPEMQERWRECWNQIYWQPKRYIKRDIAKRIADSCVQSKVPLAEMLSFHAGQVHASVAEKMNALGADITWLMEAFATSSATARPAAEVLQEFEERIGYTDYLRKSSGFAETGADRAATVEAFIRYARNQGLLLDFLQSVKRLSDQNERLAQTDDGDKLLLTTIFRAKGLEWQHVFIPNCNDEIYPHKLNPSREEERRLLYVAITRAKSALYLHALKDEPLSPFLAEAKCDNLLNSVAAVADALQKSPSQWNGADVRAVAIHAPRVTLESFITQRWQPADGQQQLAAQLVLGCYQAIQKRGLFEPLGLNLAHVQCWQALLPKSSGLQLILLPEIEQWLDDFIKSRQRRKANALGRVRKVQIPNTQTASTPDTSRWQRGDQVYHAQHGVGRITTVSSMTDEIWVKFDGERIPQTVKRGEIRLLLSA